MDAGADPAEEVKRWANKTREATDELQKAMVRRDQAICLMRTTGASLREIAKVADVSHTQVENILRREGYE